ncbi:MAG: Major cardiolipin synthase ClsA [Planctomycetes bacterium]|nr:Major cardiolipin synthase ClsA [Planctomycetota bacterium]
MTQTLIATLVAVAIYLAELGGVALAISRKRDAPSAIAWSLAIIFLPVIGLAAFLLFGLERIPRRLKRKAAQARNVRDLFKRQLTDSQAVATMEARRGWQGLGLLAENAGAPPIMEGNDVKLLEHGQPAFDAIIEAISAAKHHVHVEEYIFRDDRLGRELLDAMIERARAGIKVRLLVDAVGSFGNWRTIRHLKKAGGEGAVFMPLLPWFKATFPNMRNHRKIVVVDGRVGFLGGLNVGEEYAGRRFRNRHWADAHLRIAGPAVSEVQRVFLEDWDFATGHMPEAAECFPMIEPCGNSRVQILSGGPDDEQNALRQAYFAAITSADKNLKIATPYLVPDLAMREALKTAAMRGVDVTILTQGKPPDSWLTYWASRYYWDELLCSGVKLFEYQRGMMHAKMVLADHAWATIGSANLDNRSLRLNFEVTASFDSPGDIRLFYERFESELKRARQVTLRGFRKRSLTARAFEELARLASPLL